MSHTIISVRDTQNIQTTTTNEGQEVNICDDPEANHTRIYELKENGSFGQTYAIPKKNKKKVTLLQHIHSPNLII